MGGPPVAEPTPRPLPDPPPCSAGHVWNTIKDWYDFRNNFSELIQGDKWKLTHGIDIKVGLNSNTGLVKGWSHSTVLGWSRSRIYGFENKLLVGLSAAWLRGGKVEIIQGNKTEVMLLGVKIQDVKGKRTKFVGAEKMDASVLKKKKKMIRRRLHFAVMKRLVAQTLEQHVSDLREELKKLEETTQNKKQEYKKWESESDDHVEKANALSIKSRQARIESDSVKKTAKGKFEIVAGAAQEFKANGELKGKAGGDVNIVANNLVSFAASLSKLG